VAGGMPAEFDFRRRGIVPDGAHPVKKIET
jgi:hypothetical protein